MQKMKKVLIFASLIILLLFFVIGKNVYDQNIRLAPDFIQNNFFSDVLHTNYTLGYNFTPENISKENIFGIRGGKISPEGKLIPGVFIGYIIFMSLAKSISDEILYFCNYLLIVFSFFYVFKIARFFLSFNKSLITAFLFLCSAPILYYSNLPINNSLEIFLFIMFIFYVLKFDFIKDHMNL